MRVRTDYLLHLFAGYIVASVFYISEFWNISMTAATIAGILKEVYDYVSEKGNADIKDALCTISGGLLLLFVETLKDFIL